MEGATDRRPCLPWRLHRPLRALQAARLVAALRAVGPTGPCCTWDGPRITSAAAPGPPRAVCRSGLRLHFRSEPPVAGRPFQRLRSMLGCGATGRGGRWRRPQRRPCSSRAHARCGQGPMWAQHMGMAELARHLCMPVQTYKLARRHPGPRAAPTAGYLAVWRSQPPSNPASTRPHRRVGHGCACGPRQAAGWQRRRAADGRRQRRRLPRPSSSSSSSSRRLISSQQQTAAVRRPLPPQAAAAAAPAPAPFWRPPRRWRRPPP